MTFNVQTSGKDAMRLFTTAVGLASEAGRFHTKREAVDVHTGLQGRAENFSKNRVSVAWNAKHTAVEAGFWKYFLGGSS